MNRYEIKSDPAVRTAYETVNDRETCFRFTWDGPAVSGASVEICYRMPSAGIQYCWHPICHLDRPVMGGWRKVTSRIASSAPVYCLLGSDGLARYTLALSDCARRIECAMGVREEDACVVCRVCIPLEGLAGEYRITLRETWDKVSLPETLDAVRTWWESLGHKPMPVPQAARLPLYSTWYSYHQTVFAKEIEEECAQAAALGMYTLIVDDGWQTDDGNRGYGYCGDWAPTPRKIPDMRAHVQAVHDAGLKYMLWYSVSFIGRQSNVWNRFKDKVLYTYDRLDAGVLDPRYPDVRQYLIDIYAAALTAWNLDGFKLDFIDSFVTTETSRPSDPEMDIPVLEVAVERLMTDIAGALSAIKPEILIEFRQSYTGPIMRTYGNMFRVGDCPTSELRNRVGVIDIRLLAGNSAVHSDMIMWHPDERVEDAARQVLTALFGVAQISVKLAQQPETHRKMLKFWLNFMQAHIPLLQLSPLSVEAPHLLYPIVSARRDGESVVAVYDADHVARLPQDETVYLVNASPSQDVYAVIPEGSFEMTVRNCMGELCAESQAIPCGLTKLMIPQSGLAILKKRQ